MLDLTLTQPLEHSHQPSLNKLGIYTKPVSVIAVHLLLSKKVVSFFPAVSKKIPDKPKFQRMPDFPRVYVDRKLGWASVKMMK